MKTSHAVRALNGILRREMLRTLRQRGRLLSAMVRPLVWLAIFAAGFRSVLGLSITPPYQTYVLYEVYVVPGLAAMMLLFHAMASSLAMVYDREMGSMRLLLTAPLPRWYLLAARLLASVIVVMPLVYLFLVIARYWDVRPPALGYVAAFPALLLSGLMLGAFGLLVSSVSTQMENFAGVMNFVIFPMFFASTALYPLWRLAEAGPVLATIAAWNPFSSAVELIRFALYLRFDAASAFVVFICLLAFFLAAVVGYDPGRGLWSRRPGS
ncbi:MULTISPECIES: ABC transporter permease [Mesorhizobium]|uniref:Transport permease protein n=1 Tax=Mesorhizobium opportunistum (strain LMG 24607 / HAMBI 3007 / WSM2075) TaxID=536019 RepID=F7YAM6_MESOW|nr:MULTISPECIES: ABC transporter permease [Mesorhizobium]AEH88786.1 ABC-2 type transporter [Mesorhizobium opportunistum WSM2075]TPN57274.1 multidrug ABC transporter permease [Mesorhizobium sp. B1-1-7]TPN57781.1 multidrug ABC transporter permease [Mesorhizobium sp. B1-1-9]